MRASQGATHEDQAVERWLRERGARERIVLATKCGGAMGTGPNDQGLSRKHIIGASKPEQLEDSLRGVDLTLDDDDLRACDDVWYALPRERDPLIARR
ncbi:MAG TPA: hypothetical protein VFZ66_22490 [Herpetosiphonaceae bacterium]